MTALICLTGDFFCITRISSKFHWISNFSHPRVAQFPPQ